MIKDLLGHDISVEEARAIELAGKKKRKPTQPSGYATKPGSGPAGETCKTCCHAWRANHGNGHFWKCELVKPTRGPGTDIRLKSPACSMWKRKSKNEEGET